MNALSIAKDQIEQKYSECSSLGELFKALEKELFAQGHVVCQFRVNGMNLTEDDEKRLASASLTEVETFEVGFEAPEKLISGALENWIRDLPYLLQHCDDISVRFRFKKGEESLTDFVQLIDECQMLVDSLIAVNSLLSGHPIVIGEKWLGAQRSLGYGIGEALQVFQKKDFTQLADILEYEIGSSLQTWLEVLAEVRKSLHESAADTTGKPVATSAGKSESSVGPLGGAKAE